MLEKSKKIIFSGAQKRIFHFFLKNPRPLSQCGVQPVCAHWSCVADWFSYSLFTPWYSRVKLNGKRCETSLLFTNWEYWSPAICIQFFSYLYAHVEKSWLYLESQVWVENCLFWNSSYWCRTEMTKRNWGRSTFIKRRWSSSRVSTILLSMLTITAFWTRNGQNELQWWLFEKRMHYMSRFHLGKVFMSWIHRDRTKDDMERQRLDYLGMKNPKDGESRLCIRAHEMHILATWRPARDWCGGLMDDQVDTQAWNEK